MIARVRDRRLRAAEAAPAAINLMLAGLLTGNEWGGWVAVHPALDKLPPPDRLRAEQALYARYGKIMPFLMTATVASGVVAASQASDRGSPHFRLTATGTACYGAMLCVTLAGNVPINRQILTLCDDATGHAQLPQLRRRWDRLHSVRNLLNMTGLGLTVAGGLAGACARR